MADLASRSILNRAPQAPFTRHPSFGTRVGSSSPLGGPERALVQTRACARCPFLPLAAPTSSLVMTALIATEICREWSGGLPHGLNPLDSSHACADHRTRGNHLGRQARLGHPPGHPISLFLRHDLSRGIEGKAKTARLATAPIIAG